MIIFVKLPGDVENAIAARREKLKKYKLPLQPLLVVVGQTVLQTFVSIDSLLYRVPSVLQAFDICFKSFHVLQTNYPPESEHIWRVVQHLIYNLNTKYDKKIPLVEKIIQDITKM